MDFETTYFQPISQYLPTLYSLPMGPKISNFSSPAMETKLKKCMALKGLLIDGWNTKFHKSPFISLLDSHKVAFCIAVQDLNRILQESVFTDTERKRIKKLRYQGRNNKAAQTLRIKNKRRENALSYSVYQLEKARISLSIEKEQLTSEICFYQKALSTSSN